MPSWEASSTSCTGGGGGGGARAPDGGGAGGGGRRAGGGGGGGLVSGGNTSTTRLSGGGGGGGGRRRGGRGGGGGRASPAKSKSERSAGLVGRPSRSRRFSEDDSAPSELSTVEKRSGAARGEGVVGVIETSNDTEPPECGSRSSCDTPRARTAGGAADGSTSRSKSDTPRAAGGGREEEETGRTWSCSAAKSKPAMRAGVTMLEEIEPTARRALGGSHPPTSTIEKDFQIAQAALAQAALRARETPPDELDEVEDTD